MKRSPYLSRSVRRLAFIAVAIGLPCSIVELTQAQAPFFQGKTVTIIQGRDPGGTGDLRTKALVPFLQKYLPGNPTIMMEYMPGAGGRMAANHLFRTAKPDGPHHRQSEHRNDFFRHPRRGRSTIRHR